MNLPQPGPARLLPRDAPPARAHLVEGDPFPLAAVHLAEVVDLAHLEAELEPGGDRPADEGAVGGDAAGVVVERRLAGAEGEKPHQYHRQRAGVAHEIENDWPGS